MHKNVHLIASSLILIPIALAYGIGPDFPETFNFSIENIDLKNILRAIMGLYVAMVVLWITGVMKQEYWKLATITVVLFMGGLAIGRLLSIVLDGVPSIRFVIGTFAEFVLSFWGIWNLKKYKDTTV